MNNKYGKVYLIGAGPGDPKLITVKGLEALKSADAVLFDRLASPLLLRSTRSDAEIIFVGKEAGFHYASQTEIIKLLIEKAKEGKSVARLKGGDPLIFGRGSEEAIELTAAGIDFEIIPGITAASGATTYSGIPLTHRNMVTQCVFVTAHEAPGKGISQVDWHLLAQMKYTAIAIYMGAAMLPKISQTLIENGLSPEHPAAAIENGTSSRQRTIVSTISELPELAAKHHFQPPMITVISPAITLRNEINWFETKPLFGKRIVVTRALEQASGFAEQLADNGAEPVLFPVISISSFMPQFDFEKILNEAYDWIFFTSENGVNYFFNYLKNNNIASIPNSAKIAAIGAVTAQAVARHFIRADFVPETFTSAALLKEFLQKYKISGKNILRVKGDFESDPLTDGLRNQGANVNTIQVYTTITVKKSESAIQTLLSEKADAITFTSPSTVKAFFEILTAETALEYLKKVKCFSIGPVTTKALEQYGIFDLTTAERHDSTGMTETLSKTCRNIPTGNI